MALARTRRSESGFTTGPALSTRCRAGALDRFLLSVFLVVQFFLSQEVTGKDKALEALNAKIAQLNDLLSLENSPGSTSPTSLRRHARDCHRWKQTANRIKGLYEASPAPAATPRARHRTQQGAGFRKGGLVARIGPDRGAEPADQRHCAAKLAALEEAL